MDFHLEEGEAAVLNIVAIHMGLVRGIDILPVAERKAPVLAQGLDHRRLISKQEACCVVVVVGGLR
jgi:uncharacterized metal-binding protein